jgi:hypothetical protein
MGFLITALYYSEYFLTAIFLLLILPTGTAFHKSKEMLLKIFKIKIKTGKVKIRLFLVYFGVLVVLCLCKFGLVQK